MKKVQDYIQNNKKLSRFDTRLYFFIKELYLYLINPKDDKIQREKLYNMYTIIMDFSFGLNNEEPQKELIDEIFARIMFLIDREYSGPRTFILLNNYEHYRLLREAINKIKNLSTDEFYGFADTEEFYTEIKKIKGII